MSHTPTGTAPADEDNGDEYPDVPLGVLRGIEDAEEGNTVSSDELDDILKF